MGFGEAAAVPCRVPRALCGWQSPAPLICRFVLQPGALPPEARLPANLAGLRARSAALEAAACWVEAGDFADVVLDVGTQRFRCHCCVLAAR